MKTFKTNIVVFLSIIGMTFPPQRCLSIQNIQNTQNSAYFAEIKMALSQEHLHSQKLKALFVKFQKQYLNFEFQKAQYSLKQIVELSFLRDWNTMERKILSTAYLRLAQMDELYRYKWVNEFLAFNEEVFIDEKLFPPQFVKWVKNKHKEYQAKTSSWYGENLPEDVKYIVINGEIFDRLGFSRKIHPQLKYRVSLIEDNPQQNNPLTSYQEPFLSMVLNGQNLIIYPFKPSQILAEANPLPQKILLKGSSVDHRELYPFEDHQKDHQNNTGALDKSYVDKSIHVIDKKTNKNNKNIQEQNRDQKVSTSDPSDMIAFADSDKKLSFNLTSLASGSGFSDTNNKADLTKGMMKKGLLTKNQDRSSKSFFKQHIWLWIILGGIGTGLLVSQIGSSKKKPPPKKVHATDTFALHD